MRCRALAGGWPGGAAFSECRKDVAHHRPDRLESQTDALSPQCRRLHEQLFAARSRYYVLPLDPDHGKQRLAALTAVADARIALIEGCRP